MLRRCIESLAKGDNSYIPYRDSKLTRLLQDSIGGTADKITVHVFTRCQKRMKVKQHYDLQIRQNVMQHHRITEMKVIDKEYVEKMERELDELRAKVIQYESDNGGIVVNTTSSTTGINLPKINTNNGSASTQHQKRAMRRLRAMIQEVRNAIFTTAI